MGYYVAAAAAGTVLAPPQLSVAPARACARLRGFPGIEKSFVVIVSRRKDEDDDEKDDESLCFSERCMRQ